LGAVGSTITVPGEGEGTWKDCDGAEDGADDGAEDGGSVTEEDDSADLNEMRSVHYSDHRRGETKPQKSSITLAYGTARPCSSSGAEKRSLPVAL